MSFRTKFALILASATLALYTLVGGWIATRAQQPANDPNAQLRIFESVLQHIQNDYVDDPNMDKVRAGALRGLAYGLDPYSTYLTPEQVKNYRSDGKTNQVGIGAAQHAQAQPRNGTGPEPSPFQGNIGRRDEVRDHHDYDAP